MTEQQRYQRLVRIRRRHQVLLDYRDDAVTAAKTFDPHDVDAPDEAHPYRGANGGHHVAVRRGLSGVPR